MTAAGNGFAGKAKVAIVDYGVGNLFSLRHACRTVGLDSVLTTDGREFGDAAAVILPGVGAFGPAMTRLKQAGMAEMIRDVAVSGKPLIGICLGFQLLMTESLEHGRHEGLGLIEGCVRGFREKFPDRSVRVPNIGWRLVHRQHEAGTDVPGWAGTPLEGLDEGQEFYFVHSYYADVTEAEIAQCRADFEGLQYCCAIAKGNIYGFQFHPERSGRQGLEVLAGIRRLVEATDRRILS